MNPVDVSVDLIRAGRDLHLDAAQSGIGTATCGPGVLPQYLVNGTPTEISFRIKPVTEGVQDNWAKWYLK